MASQVFLHPGMTLLDAAKAAARRNCCLVYRNGRILMAPINSPEPKLITAQQMRYKRTVAAAERWQWETKA